MNKKTTILALVCIAILFGLMAYGSMQMKKPPTVTEPYPTYQTFPQSGIETEQNVQPSTPKPSEPQNPSNEVIIGGGKGGAIACTMDAKMCPDGTYVGRTGPSCEFTPCPGN